MIVLVVVLLVALLVSLAFNFAQWHGAHEPSAPLPPPDPPSARNEAALMAALGGPRERAVQP